MPFSATPYYIGEIVKVGSQKWLYTIRVEPIPMEVNKIITICMTNNRAKDERNRLKIVGARVLQFFVPLCE